MNNLFFYKTQELKEIIINNMKTLTKYSEVVSLRVFFGIVCLFKMENMNPLRKITNH